MASTFTLPAGTVCKRNGMPFVLQHATQIECQPDSWPAIEGEQPRTLYLSDAPDFGVSIQFGDDAPMVLTAIELLRLKSSLNREVKKC